MTTETFTATVKRLMRDGGMSLIDAQIEASRPAPPAAKKRPAPEPSRTSFWGLTSRLMTDRGMSLSDAQVEASRLLDPQADVPWPFVDMRAAIFFGAVQR